MKESSKKSYEEAVALIKTGDLDSARKKLLNLSVIDPTSTAIYAVLGKVYWDMHLLDEAVNAFRCGTKLNPTLEAVSLGLFHCLWELNKRKEALEEVERFMSVSDSEDYREIVREINEKRK